MRNYYHAFVGTWISLHSCICILQGLPVPIKKPHGISSHSISILITVPTEGGMTLVFNIENAMAEARFPVSRIVRLWLPHPELIT